jgi:hypothetical protein
MTFGCGDMEYADCGRRSGLREKMFRFKGRRAGHVGRTNNMQISFGLDRFPILFRFTLKRIAYC